MNYEEIKALAKSSGRRATELIVLAPQNDPFYTGTPNDWALGEWFATLWHAFRLGSGVHLRRIHYLIISQDPPISFPNGKPYENTQECWEALNMASKAARYLNLVDPAAFDDRRSPAVNLYASDEEARPRVSTNSGLWRDTFALPEFPELPAYSVSGFRSVQPYHLEVWCEKSTQNDVLKPLCSRYGVNLQTGSGELSITATLGLVQRLEQAGKPARIFYVSDFDPAGQSMPVAVARKVEYFIAQYELDLDVRLFPVVLTLDQIRHYRLPRTPIKETERRRSGFETRYGEGAVELDALEALYPGELERILTGYLEQYYDTTLVQRVEDVERNLGADLEETWQLVMGVYGEDVAALREEHLRIQQEFEARMGGYSARLQSVWQAIRQELQARIPDVADYPLPEPLIGHEVGPGLYDSARGYLEQIDAYKQFQGKQETSVVEVL